MDYWLKKCNTIYFKVGRVLIILMVVLFISLPGLSANSQAVTELAFQPEVAEVTIGDTVIMKLDVKNGVNLSGYDLVIRYDPGVIELKSWAHGTYLSNLAVMRAVLQPGIIELAAVQVGKPGVNGDGTLLSLTFTALHSGDTPVYLESIVLAAADGQRVYPEDQRWDDHCQNTCHRNTNTHDNFDELVNSHNNLYADAHPNRSAVRRP